MTRGILASFVFLAALLGGQPTIARPNYTKCCEEGARSPGSVRVGFERRTPEERIEEIAAELGVTVRWIIDLGIAGVLTWWCVPTGQEETFAQVFETYPEVRAARVFQQSCWPHWPECGCCPTGYVCDNLRPCEPQFVIPDGDNDGFTDWCDACTGTTFRDW